MMGMLIMAVTTNAHEINCLNTTISMPLGRARQQTQSYFVANVKRWSIEECDGRELPLELQPARQSGNWQVEQPRAPTQPPQMGLIAACSLLVSQLKVQSIWRVTRPFTFQGS